MNAAQILVVEDEPAIAQLIGVNLRHAGFSYENVSNVEDARMSINRVLPDLVLLDWMLPGESGLSLAQSLRHQERTHRIPIIMLTARGDDGDIVKGLEAGADDYIVKPFSPQEMIARIKALLRRLAPEAVSEVIDVMGLRLEAQTQTLTWQEKNIRLGASEFKLMNFLMCHTGRVYSRSALLDKVWGDHVYIEERTIDVHVKRLRSALMQIQAPDMIETIRGLGYRFKTQQD